MVLSNIWNQRFYHDTFKFSLKLGAMFGGAMFGVYFNLGLKAMGWWVEKHWMQVRLINWDEHNTKYLPKLAIIKWTTTKKYVYDFMTF